MNFFSSIVCLFLLLSFTSCGSTERNATVSNSNKEQSKSVSKPQNPIKFNVDSAYSYVASQCAFGPRTIGSDAHAKCVDYLSSELARHGGAVSILKGSIKNWKGTEIPVKNISAKFSPEKKDRIILFSHYDSRPWADKDLSVESQMKPIDGANDGASSCGVILEVARQYSSLDSPLGLDVVFFDAEDWGEPSFLTGRSDNYSWCLGSQVWSQSYQDSIKPMYGILLDMVGGENPTFQIDDITESYASITAAKIWTMAKSLGYDDMFQFVRSGSIIDDHFYVNKYTGIPTVDIIDFNSERGFPEVWHTSNDVLSNISKNSLEAVGKTIVALLVK